jgi:hypothetical protein
MDSDDEGGDVRVNRNSEAPQVRIQVLRDGQWHTPLQVPAGLAALRAIGADIREYPGDYSGKSLREFREALGDLSKVITSRIGDIEDQET